MKKKLVSLLLTGSMVLSMGALATVSASAIIDENGAYVPGDNVTCGTNRYYFALPKTWECEFSTVAGAYWYNGTDACGAVDGTGGDLAWPGYKAQLGDYASDNYTLYYVDCPKDVPQIIWNNYVNGGTDTEAPIYLTAKQSNDAPTEFYSEIDSDLYPSEFFAEMEESSNGDKAALGEYADNFFVDEEFGLGFCFNLDNMIFIVPNEPNGVTFEGKPTYVGDWYFYYGDGEYGTYPTKEDAIEKGVYGNLAAGPSSADEGTTDPTLPTAGEGTTDPTSPTAGDNNNNTEETTVGQPSTDPTSSVNGSSTGDTANSNSNGNGTVQTGEANYAFIALLALVAASGVAIVARKKFI